MRGPIFEHHYVCLDHRSEVAHFNSQLDASINHTALRLHFFKTQIDISRIYNLRKADCESYLGYIVCRDSGGPIVGRSVLKPPSYVTTYSAIDEPVNFLGQQLWVSGVPFMQQDERFVVCAHVAMWILLYTGFRRRLIERKLIAEVVAVASTLKPMHPVMPPGIYPNEVVPTLVDLGLGAVKYDTAFEAEADLPLVPPKSVELPEDEILELELVLNSIKRAEQSHPQYVDWTFAASPSLGGGAPNGD